MPDDRLRLLALWHARRREVDEMLEPLLVHGPAAVSRVGGQLSALALAVEAEHEAFSAFCAAQPGAAGAAGDELAGARDRSAASYASSSDAARGDLQALVPEPLSPEPDGVVVDLDARRATAAAGPVTEH